MNTEPFTVDYQRMQKQCDTVVGMSVQDPGQGHEGHQLAVLVSTIK